MTTKNNSSALAIFLLGLTSQTQIQIIGFMDISELLCYIMGPYFLVTDYSRLMKHGFGKFLLVWLLATVGAIISSWWNGSPSGFFLRGIANPISVLCITCVFHHYLSRDMGAYKWFFLGQAISMIICIFVFHRGSTMKDGVMLTGAEGVERVTGYSLFWLSMIGTWLILPIQMFYLKTPKWYSLAFGVWFMIYGFVNAGSRSGLAVSFVSIILIVVAGKSSRRMALVKKHFFAFLIFLLIAAPILGFVYKYCAINNYLGDQAYKKYISQSSRGTNILGLIRGGRSEFFIGLEACIDRPIVGWGPWALDTKDYVRKDLERYASYETLKYHDWLRSIGRSLILPCHSWLISFWCWYGILGLICMVYVGWLFAVTLKKYLDVMPELYGYFAYALPAAFWAWLFSPFGTRTVNTLLMVLCLFVKAIHENKFHCPDLTCQNTELKFRRYEII